MKTNKTVCDMCGEIITEAHPTRLVLQNYKVHSHYGGYRGEINYDICPNCIPKVKEMLSGGKK